MKRYGAETCIDLFPAALFTETKDWQASRDDIDVPADDPLSGFENTALCAVNFFKAVNISIPVDCVDLRRWYTTVTECRSN